MAKAAKIARNAQREQIVARYAERRAQLKAIIASPLSTPGEKNGAIAELQRQPRNASRVRLRNRDVVDGRPRGHLRKFGLSRVRMRQLALRGELPGVTKSSW
ncbi:30S ribosomal protein S14 [Rarobacter incanus]|uniref:Small ribosomal subunit protein uS14 n=1 Tax=Rarobacter incanus TaxID=153494 RepID=A0A542SQQ2_9MICO|nr:30S ribosomal protein S14 [Rarobacter incanus]TQK76956.1 small subunit ribosomal protein S14 [Rarobacter incanus]